MFLRLRILFHILDKLEDVLGIIFSIKSLLSNFVKVIAFGMKNYNIYKVLKGFF